MKFFLYKITKLKIYFRIIMNDHCEKIIENYNHKLGIGNNRRLKLIRMKLKKNLSHKILFVFKTPSS